MIGKKMSIPSKKLQLFTNSHGHIFVFVMNITVLFLQLTP